MKKIHKYSSNYLFEKHPKSKISLWVNQLQYFYYNRAWGGHAGDGDNFSAYFEISNEDFLKSITDKLQIKLDVLPNDNPRPIPGKSYSAIEFREFKTAIKNFPKYKQPGRQVISGICVFVWIDHNNLMKISISGGRDKNYYEVSDIDYENCLILEGLFKQKGISPIRTKEIEQRATIITKDKYPEFFKANFLSRIVDKLKKKKNTMPNNGEHS